MVYLCRGQAQFSLMPALVKAGDTCGFFQYAPSAFGFGVDQFGDLALPHEGGGVRARGGIGKQHLDIARAHLFGVGFIGRSGIAGDAADNFDLVGFVEPGWRQAFGIVDHQRHFGKVARRAGGSAGENHIFHFAAAHGGGAVFAHDPTDRLQKVGFAAAIGADNACQTLMDHQIRRVYKAFEAIEAQAGKAQPKYPMIPKVAYTLAKLVGCQPNDHRI